MLYAYAMDFKGIVDEKLSLIGFLCNNSYQVSIEMVPYEALCCRRCCTLLYWSDINNVCVVGVDILPDKFQKVRIIQAWIKAAHSR